MQNKGYRIIPSTCKKSTVNYEFVLKHKSDGHKAVAQVKKGNVDLHLENYKDLNSKVYLFTTKGNYIGIKNPNISLIDKDRIHEFIQEYHKIMPDKILTWTKMYEKLKIFEKG